MSEPQTWRELLGQCLTSGQEKERIASLVGVNPLTLTRWVNDEAKPRLSNIHRLLDALPKYRSHFLELLPDDLKPIFDEAKDLDGAHEIPTPFYTSVLNAFTTTAPALRFRAICDLILLQALQQLDPNRVGIEITVVRCMPPAPQYIRSLRETVGLGTNFWERGLDQRTMFLGAESLAGYVVASGRPLAIQTRSEWQYLFPAHWISGEESAAAHPIIRAGRIAGCLLVSCSQPNFFLPSRLDLMQSYAHLLVLAFMQEEFYEFERIALKIMPSYERQKVILSTIRQRMSDMMKQAASKQQPLNMKEAEQMIWQQLEEELLQLQSFR